MSQGVAFVEILHGSDYSELGTFFPNPESPTLQNLKINSRTERTSKVRVLSWKRDLQLANY